MTQNEIQRLIKKEKKKLTSLCKNYLDADKIKTIEGLIENAAFMKVALLDLQELIQHTGFIEEYQNGENQSGFKESTAVRTYNSMIKNYNTTIKSIIGILPAETAGSSKDELLAFIKR